MRFLKIILLVAVAASSSCYEDYVYDHDTTTAGFSMQQPLRTVVHDTPIYLGVSISGKRDVDMSDWAKFTIDASLLNGTGLTLLPSSHYKLDDPEVMRVRKSNMPVADVKISFTDAFYADPNSITTYYALPLRITDSSLDAIREGGETQVAAIKYISSYSGTYYALGSVSTLDNLGTVISTEVYREQDLNKNLTRYLSTEGPMVVSRPGVGRIVNGGLLLTISDAVDPEGNRNVTVETYSAAVPITEASGRYVKNGEYDFAGNGKTAPQIELQYKYETAGTVYQVSEKLVLRREPADELKVEQW